MKEITEIEVNKIFKDGARNLFHWYEFKFFDIGEFEDENFYVITRINDDETTSYFQIDVKDMYDIVTIYHYADSHSMEELLTQKINSLGIAFNE